MCKGNRTVIFFRKEGFYPVELTPKCKIEEHVRLNPGTLKVETIDGKVLWPEGARSSRDGILIC